MKAKTESRSSLFLKHFALRERTSLFDSASVLALSKSTLGKQCALCVIYHYAGFVVVPGAFCACRVGIGLACLFDSSFVAFRFLGASVEFVFYSVAKVFDGFDFVSVNL